MPLVSFYTPWKHQKTCFSDLFRGYRKRPVTWNGLTLYAKYQKVVSNPTGCAAPSALFWGPGWPSSRKSTTEITRNHMWDRLCPRICPKICRGAVKQKLERKKQEKKYDRTENIFECIKSMFVCISQGGYDCITWSRYDCVAT